jgi:hypothetical protein
LLSGIWQRSLYKDDPYCATVTTTEELVMVKRDDGDGGMELPIQEGWITLHRGLKGRLMRVGSILPPHPATK